MGFKSIFLRHICRLYPAFPAVILGLFTPLCAQSSFNWLTEAVHPRGMALAHSTVADGDPTEALNLNPAALFRLDPGRNLMAGYCRYPAGLGQAMSQLILPAGAQLVGIEVRHFGYGTFSGYDDDGIKQADYTAADNLVRVGIARPAGDFLKLGATAAILNSRLAEATATAVLWSLGVELEITPVDAHLGAVIQNQGWITQQFAASQSDELPSTWLVGIAKSLAYLPLTLYFAAGKNVVDGLPLWRLGGEFQLPGRLALRLGIDQDKTGYSRGSAYPDLLSGFSLGIGMASAEGSVSRQGTGSKRLYGMSLDGAVKFLGPLGTCSSIALGLVF